MSGKKDTRNGYIKIVEYMEGRKRPVHFRNVAKATGMGPANASRIMYAMWHRKELERLASGVYVNPFEAPEPQAAPHPEPEPELEAEDFIVDDSEDGEDESWLEVEPVTEKQRDLIKYLINNLWRKVNAEGFTRHDAGEVIDTLRPLTGGKRMTKKG